MKYKLLLLTPLYFCSASFAEATFHDSERMAPNHLDLSGGELLHNDGEQCFMNLEEIYNIQRRINKELKEQVSKFEKLRSSTGSLIEKWQEFIGIVLPIQLQVIQEFGFFADQKGLSEFNEQLMQFASEDESLRMLNEAKWRFLLEKAFGLRVYRELSLEEARNLIGDISEAMTDDEFLSDVDQLVESWEESLSMTSRRKELLEILFPLHISIMERHGFEGEKGYLQAQRAIMDYYYDAFIMEKASHAQNILFKRAKLIGETHDAI